MLPPRAYTAFPKLQPQGHLGPGRHPWQQLTHSSSHVSQRAVARCHLEKGPILWAWVSSPKQEKNHELGSLETPCHRVWVAAVVEGGRIRSGSTEKFKQQSDWLWWWTSSTCGLLWRQSIKPRASGLLPAVAGWIWELWAQVQQISIFSQPPFSCWVVHCLEEPAST